MDLAVRIQTPHHIRLVSLASCSRSTGAARDDTLSATVRNPASQPATNQAEPPVGRASTKESNGGEVVDVQAIKHHARIHFPTTPEAPQIMIAKPQHRLSTGPGGRDNLLNPAAKPMAPKGPQPQLPPKAIEVKPTKAIHLFSGPGPSGARLATRQRAYHMPRSSPWPDCTLSPYCLRI